MNKGDMMRLLGKYDNVDSAIPAGFVDCVNEVKYGKKNSNCGFNIDADQIVWDYQKPKNGQPTHLGEELFTQVMEGKIIVIPAEKMKKIYAKLYDVADNDIQYLSIEGMQKELLED